MLLGSVEGMTQNWVPIGRWTNATRTVGASFGRDRTVMAMDLIVRRGANPLHNPCRGERIPAIVKMKPVNPRPVWHLNELTAGQPGVAA